MCCAKAAGERLAQACHSIPAAPFGAENAVVHGRAACVWPLNYGVASNARLFSTADGFVRSPAAPVVMIADLRVTGGGCFTMRMPKRCAIPMPEPGIGFPRPLTHGSREHFSAIQ